MGIQGLLAFLRNTDENVSAITPSHLSKFRGKKAAVDTYSWLHKAVFSCANDLFLNKPTTKYVDYCLKNLKVLQDNHITPVLVFDGGRMPFKIVEKKRREDRQRAKKEADDLIAAGRMNEAYNQMVQSINITHEMASNLIKAARKIGIESVVAPYEADAQLVYLEKEGLVDFIISEDSDLIIFGAKKIFLKMALSGHGELFDFDKIELCLQANKRLKGKFCFEKLFLSAILSGCDYLKNLPGVGLIKAWKFMHMTENTDVRQFLKKVPSYLKLNSIVVDDEYIESFILAYLAFKYQLVFDTRQKRRVPLHSLDNEISKDDYNKFLSKFTSSDLDHLQLALGNIDSKSNQYDSYHPHFTSYLFGGYEEKKIVESPKSVNAFNVEGAYKRTRNSNVRKSITEPKHEQIPEDDQELANYYKNLDTSPVIPVVKKEEIIVQPRKRIKCKFLKFKPKEDDFELVRSRFFKSKDDSLKTDDDVEQNEEVEIKTEGKKEERSSDIVIIKEEQEDKKDDECYVNDIPKENIKLLNNQEEAEMRKIFADAGVEIDSENSNDVPDVDKEFEVPVTPVKLTVEITPNSETPESPVVSTQIAQVKSKLKEIQNVQKFSKTKKKLIPKNQPTLLGFFNKL